MNNDDQPQPQGTPRIGLSDVLGVMYRDIIFREKIYSDGLTVLVSIEAKCLSDSHQPIPFQSAVVRLREWMSHKNSSVRILPRWWEHGVMSLFPYFEDWWKRVSVEKLSPTQIEFLYQKEVINPQLDAYYRPPETRKTGHSALELKCCDSFSDLSMTPNDKMSHSRQINPRANLADTRPKTRSAAAVVLHRIVRRANSWLTRRQKRKPKVWLVRVRCAFDNLWLRFYRMPRTEQTLQWAERNHARIINIKPPWRARWHA